MPKYYVSGLYSMTQEYSFQTEVEADTPEEAAQKFAEEAEHKATWWEIESFEVDKPYDMNGSFSVYESEQDRDDWENALIEGEGFEGYR
jgi:hypothetical protein